MTDSESNKKKAKGFAGLSSMVSDVSADATLASKAEQAAPPTAPALDPPTPQHAQAKPVQAESSPAPKSGKTALACIVAVVAVFVIWMANSGSADHGQPPAADGGATAPDTPMASAVSATSDVAATVFDEQMPPVGRNNVLDITQIRWCKREQLKIEAIEGLINNAYEREVASFNAKVDDYNSRCAEFKYRRGQLEQVERELVAQRGEIGTTSQMQWSQAWVHPPDAPVAARNDEPEPFLLGQAHGKTPQPASQVAAPDMGLSEEEQASIDSACADQKLLYGDAAYEKCASKKKSSLNAGPRNIDLSALTAPERESIESACSDQKLVHGPAQYNACLVRKLSALKAAPRNIDLSELSQSERESMESSCLDQKLVQGPAAYNRCMSRKLASLRAGPRNVDLSNLSEARRGSIESTCSDQRLVQGPAAYNKCLTQKIGRQ